MSSTEQISISLPPELAHLVRAAVVSGEYSSNSDVIRDALQDWTDKRKQNSAKLRQDWQEAVDDASASFSADEVLNRLERKYQAMADACTAK